MKDLHSHVAAIALLAAATYSADAASSGIDLAGYNSAEILLYIDDGGITFDATNKIEFVLEESDDNSTWTAVAAKDVLGVDSVTSGIIKALVAAHSEGVYRFGYVGTKRYIRLTANFSGTHGTGTPICALLIKGHPELSPVADAA